MLKGRGEQCDADEIGPEQAERHIGWHGGQDEGDVREMECAEDRERDGETKIGRGDEFVEAIGTGDVCLGGPQGDEEKQDAGAAHGNHCARSCEEQDEKSDVHGCGRCIQRLDHQYSFGLYSYGDRAEFLGFKAS